MRLTTLVLVALTAGCAATAPTATTTPTSTTGPAAAGGDDGAAVDPFAVSGTLSQETLPAKPPGMPLRKLAFPKLPKGVGPAPSSCRPYAKAAPGGSPCQGAADLAAIDLALRESDPLQRDRKLAALAVCTPQWSGLLAALRAELAPIECGDLIVSPVLDKPSPDLDGMVYDALFGLGLAARLARTGAGPPKLDPPYDKKRVKAFHQGPMLAWSSEQAKAIQDMSELGAKLGFYGKAVVAVEAGMADMRFVDVVRAVPVPEEYAGDKELEDRYYMGLDEALEPRKSRGRDAALVGLRGLAYVGVIRDPRIGRARRLLSRMYGGRPIDALDALQLPPSVRPAEGTVEQRLAAKLPAFFAGLLLDGALATDPAILRALTTRSLPLKHRIALRAATKSPELRLIVAHARLELGRTYWRAVDVDEAVAQLAPWPEGSERPPEASLLLALGLALRGGPADAAEMIRTAPVESLGIGRVAALDALAAQSPPGPLAAQAAFDAALVRQVAAPPRAEPAYWLDLAQRFRAAARLQRDAAVRKDAEQRATDAEATARAIRK